MASVLLIGSQAPLLEGLAQMLATAGHRTVMAPATAEARDAVAGEPPLVVIAERSQAAEALRTPIAPGGTFLLYHTEDAPAGNLPPAAQRWVLAELALPLERHRLLALVKHVEERVTSTGRTPASPPPEPRAG